MRLSGFTERRTLQNRGRDRSFPRDTARALSQSARRVAPLRMILTAPPPARPAAAAPALSPHPTGCQPLNPPPPRPPNTSTSSLDRCCPAPAERPTTSHAVPDNSKFAQPHHTRATRARSGIGPPCARGDAAMAGLTQDATQLIREMLNADGTLPPYNVSCTGGAGAGQDLRARRAPRWRRFHLPRAPTAAPRPRCEPAAAHHAAARPRAAGGHGEPPHAARQRLQPGSGGRHAVRAAACALPPSRGAVPAALHATRLAAAPRPTSGRWPDESRRPAHAPTPPPPRSARKQQEAADRRAAGDGEAGPSGRAAEATGGGGGKIVDWQHYPEAAAAVVIYHELIMKVKRILLTYA